MLFMLLGWSSVPDTYLIVPVMGFGGEDIMCPVVECDISCCSCALLPPTFWVVWGECAGGVLSPCFQWTGQSL